MMIRKSIYLVLLMPILVFSQQESYYSLYRYNMNVINPAFAGAEAANMFSFTSRSQWASMENTPKTTAFSYSSARENNVGLGISVVSDKVFVEQQTFAYVDFSYKLDMGESQLYLGLKGGGNFYRADPVGLTTYLAIDPSQETLSSFNPNVGAGAYYRASSFWLSFSIPRLFNIQRDRDILAITSKDRVHAYLGGGVDFGVGNDFYLKPSVMLRKVKGLPTSADLTAMVSWQNRFDVGVSVRTNNSMALMSMISLGMFDLGYAYETPTDNGLSQLNLKTHELILRIALGGDQKTKSGPVKPE